MPLAHVAKPAAILSCARESPSLKIMVSAGIEHAALRSGQFRGQKSLGPLETSLEMAHYVVCLQKK